MWTQKHEDECKEKLNSSAFEQPTVSPVNAGIDTTRQEAEGDHDHKRRRIDEPGPPVPTDAQDGSLNTEPCAMRFGNEE